MAIQFEQKIKTPLWVNVLFYLSLILLIVIISSYFILKNSQVKADEKLIELDSQLATSKTTEEISLENYQNKINDFIFLTNKYMANSKFFDFIEKVTHPEVQFTSIAISADKKTVSLSGQTDNFQTLGQQLIVFKEEPLIHETTLSSISLGGEDEVSFNFNFLLDQIIFKK
ncbi:PilN domain-containing protein [Patescibacteria group bacterium]